MAILLDLTQNLLFNVWRLSKVILKKNKYFVKMFSVSWIFWEIVSSWPVEAVNWEGPPEALWRFLRRSLDHLVGMSFGH